MSDNLKLPIQLILDDSKVNQSLQSLRNKLSNLGSDGSQRMNPAAQQAFEMANVRMNAQKQEDLKKLEAQYNTLSQRAVRWQTQLGQMTKGTSEYEDQLKKVNIALGNLATIEDKIIQNGGNVFKEHTEGAEKATSAFENMVKSLGKIVASAAVVRGALNFGQFASSLPMQTTMNQGAISRMVMEPLQLGRQGRGYEMMSFAPERAEAMRLAQEKRERQELLDVASGVAVPALAAAGGAAVGGGLGAAVSGISALLGNSRGTLAIGAQLGLGTDTYRSILNKEQLQDYRAMTEAKRYENAAKGLGSDFLNENLGTMLDVSRTTGMSDDRLFGKRTRTNRAMVEMGGDEFTTGLSEIEEATNYGGKGVRFTASQAMRTLTELSRAGITNQQISGNLAGTAMAAQQQGVAGATGIMGAFGRINQSNTDDHFIRLFAQGLDSSRTGEDLNKFMQVTAELATRTGFVSQEMEDRLLAGAKDNSSFALEMSRQGAIELSERSGATAGLEGQVGMQFLTNKSNIIGALGEEKGNLVAKALQSDETLASEFNRLTTEDAADEKLMESLAYRMGEGVSGEDVKKLIMQKDLSKQKARIGMSGELERAYKQYVEESKKSGKIGEPSEAIYSALKSTGGLFGIGGEKGMAMFRQMVAQETGLNINPDVTKAEEKLKTQKGGVAEAALKSTATAEDAMFQGFQQYREQFEKDANAMSTSQAATVLALNAIEEAAGKASTGLQGFATMINTIISQYNQTAPAGSQIPLFKEAKASATQPVLQGRQR